MNNTTTTACTFIITKKEAQSNKESTKKSQGSCQSPENHVDLTEAGTVDNSSETGAFRTIFCLTILFYCNYRRKIFSKIAKSFGGTV